MHVFSVIHRSWLFSLFSLARVMLVIITKTMAHHTVFKCSLKEEYYTCSVYSMKNECANMFYINVNINPT